MNERGVERRSHELFAVLRRDVDEVAQHIIVPDLQRADAGGFGVAHLQRGNDAAGFVAQRTRFVEHRFVAAAHEAAVAAERRQFIAERPRQLGGNGAIRTAQPFDRLFEVAGNCSERRQPSRKFRRGENAVADSGKIARSAAADDKMCIRDRRRGLLRA